MKKHNPANEFIAQFKVGFLSTDEACAEYGARNFVPIPVSDSYWIQGEGVNNMYSLSYSAEFESPITGLQQGLQRLVEVNNPTGQKHIVLTIEQYDELKDKAAK